VTTVSTETTSVEDGPGARTLLASVVAAYREMEMSIRRYLLAVLAPATALAVGLVVAVLSLSLPLPIGVPLVAVGVFAVVVAVVFPKLARDRQRKQVRARFHLFLTHVTVLSMTNVDRVETFRTIANEDEYGVLAEEAGRIVALVDTWNRSLEDACRMRSQRVASPLLSDFLERMAYTIGAGQDIATFLTDEQDSIIQEFVIRYRNDLNRLDVLKELYLSMLMSVTFVVVFALLVPFLLGVPPVLVLGGVIGLFLVVQVGFLVVVNSVAPSDPVWYLAPERDHRPVGRLPVLLVASVVLSVAVAGVVAAALTGAVPAGPLADAPLVLVAAVPTTPLLVPGLYTRSREAEVKERDREFPSFVRALGSVESVKQSSTARVLSSLRRKNFGALTPTIDSLYKRLNVRIDTRRSWRLFAAESGSNLIQKFGDMYVVGRRMGGEPKRLGALISQNMSQVLKVREQRSQTAQTLIGVVYGVTFASVFSFYVGVEIVEMLVEITAGIDTGDAGIDFLLNADVYDIPTLRLLVAGLVVLNAVLSSVLVRLIDRGHVLTALVHLVALLWMSGVTALVTQVAVESLLAV
jgi:flagellar protein FlaJ